MRIEIPMLPPFELSPNYPRYKHWGPKAQARKSWKSAVYLCAVDARNKYLRTHKYWTALEKASIKYCFIYDVKRKRDADNLIASMKVAQDSLIEAGIIMADDTEHLSIETPLILVNKELAPKTIIEVSELMMEVLK